MEVQDPPRPLLPSQATITIRPNGPLLVQGNVKGDAPVPVKKFDRGGTRGVLPSVG